MPKTLHPGGESNPGSSVPEADTMTTLPSPQIFHAVLFQIIMHGIPKYQKKMNPSLYEVDKN
jgi:hypothetical protein